MEEEKDIVEQPVNIKIDPEISSIQKKCPLYRKKCEETIEKPVSSVDEAIQASKTSKCILYRKSCQKLTENAEEINELILKTHHEVKKLEKPVEKLADDAKLPVRKCPKYRKTCKIDKTVEKPLLAEPFSFLEIFQKSHEDKTEKCPRYRKSCVSDYDIKEQVKKEAKKIEAKAKLAEQKVKEIKQEAVNLNAPIETSKPQKCPRYRKSCEWEPSKAGFFDFFPTEAIVAFLHNNVFAKKSMIAEKASKCPKYRKSCYVKSETQEEASVTISAKSDNEPKITIKNHKKSGKKDVVFAETPPKNIKKVDEPKLQQETPSESPKPKVAKCKKYRKSCDPETDEHDSSFDISFAQKFKLLIDKFKHFILTNFGTKEEIKCPRYRKSCSRDKISDLKVDIPIEKLPEIVPEVEEEIFEVKMVNMPKVKHEKEHAAPEKVETEPVEEDQEILAEKIEPDQVPAATEESFETPIIVETLPEEPKVNIEQDVKSSRRPQRGCKLYRKSCTPKADDDDEADFPIETGSAGSGFIGQLKKILLPEIPESKCPRYRKSCRHSSAKDLSIKIEPKKKVHQEPAKAKGNGKPKPNLEAKQHQKPTTDSTKCPKYRKSCQSEDKQPKTKITTTKDENATTKSKTNQDSSSTCPKYRKSCSKNQVIVKPVQETATSNNDDDYIYILDEKTGKLRKYCKKKTTTSKDGKTDDEKQHSLLRRVINYLCKAAN